MIEAVSAVARPDAVVVATVAAASARSTLEGRQKRLRWLGALHAANGEPLPLDDEERDEAILAGNRERMRAAIGTVEELAGLAHEDEAEEEEPGEPVSAADVARLIAADQARSLGAQAHLGAVSVRHLVG